VLSVAPLTGGPGYYLELTSLNYYAEGGEPLPLWAGTVATELGLSGVAEKDHVYRLAAGFDHETGEEGLLRNAGKESRNPGHDLTFSAPKSVSIAWALSDPDLRKAIEQVQLSAVRQALGYLEEKAGFARVGTDGQKLEKCPLLFALFEHGTSRAMDPQLHTHALLINLTVHPDGRTTAVDSTYLYHFKMAAGAVYRAALAAGMQRLGFDISQRQLGSSLGFELSCIPREIIEEFSQRRAEIEEQLKLRAGSLDAASPRYAELVTKETRRTKDTEKPRAELIDGWQEVGFQYGIDAAFLRRQLSQHQSMTPAQRAQRKEALFREALDALSESQSHWNEAELTKAIAERAAGRISAWDVRELVENKLRSSEMVPLGGLQTEHRNQAAKQYIDRFEVRYSTPEIRKLETKMLVDVERIKVTPRTETPRDLVERAIRATLAQGKSLDDEQRQAVRYVTSGPGVRLLSGLAGTGKTTTLKTAVDAWRAQDRHRLIWGCAVAGAAMKRLKKGIGKEIDCDTLERTLWLLDSGRLKLWSNSVIILDEAGMVGTRHMARIIEHLKNAPGSRLILAGDAKQLQPISAGGPFKYLAQEDVLGELRLKNIYRQREVWAREAVKAFEQGRPIDAIRAFIEHKRFHLAETRPEAIGRIIEQWKKDGGVTDPTRVFLLASLNTEVKELNLRAQAERIRAGVVDAEKKIYANGVFFHEGDRLQFQKRSRPLDVENSDTGTVLRVDRERQRILVRLDEDNRVITVDLKRYSGENLRLGYASTTHKAQGASIPIVHVLMGGPLTDLHMGYVQASRSQESTHLFCDQHTAGGPGLSDLLRSLGQARQKAMAQEIVDQERGRRRERGIDQEPVRRHERGISIGF
jgi:conjugative relaxase-like TrwC/TraI family protein